MILKLEADEVARLIEFLGAMDGLCEQLTIEHEGLTKAFFNVKTEEAKHFRTILTKQFNEQVK